MATNTTNTSASNTSGTTPKKKTGKRRMKKQVRRTLGGLFLASAIAVAAIPVEPMSAKSTASNYADDSVIDPNTKVITYNKNQVRAVHYTGSDNSTYETVNGVAVDPTWYSRVPYIKADEQIYVDESDTYRFAFIRDNSGAQFAVVLGINDEKIDLSGNLTIPDVVDAYYAYANNTSSGRYSYCAVSREGKFLYYATSAPEYIVGQGTRCKTTYFEQDAANIAALKAQPRLSLNEINSTNLNSGQLNENIEFWSEMDGHYIAEFTNAMNAEAGYIDSGVSVGKPAYRIPYWVPVYDNTAGTVDPDNVTRYDITGWNQLFAYFEVRMPEVRTYAPCYIDDVDKWSPGGNDEPLYYWNKTTDVVFTDDTGFSVSDPTGLTGRVYDCKIKYIGMQSIVPIKNAQNEFTGKWSVTEPATKTNADNTVSCYPDRGVFYNQGKLINLNIGSNLAGIGDYAFYNCTSLQSVTFSNQLNTIGNGAFMNCTKLSSINPNDEGPWLNSDMSIVGASAFENCVNLSTFSSPIHVYALGDRCFKGCSSLSQINLADAAGDSNLNIIGYNIFNDCNGLQEIVIPRSLEQKVPVHYFDGCTALKKMSLLAPRNLASNDNSTELNFEFDIIDGDPYVDAGYTGGTYSETIETSTFHHSSTLPKCDIDDWLATLNEDFYFEACDNTDLHQTAKDHSAAFLYDNTSNRGCYEIVVVCEETPQHENTFVVDTNNNLVSSHIDPDCHVITIPATIGGYGVSTISSTGFNNNCSLNKVYIPNSVNKIEAGAFKGCHNLHTVYFTEPYNYGLEIGDGAFDTQAIVGDHALNCVNIEGAARKLDTYPQLNFVGPIDGTYAPFAYAMDGNNNINVDSQTPTYITYYSGWPTFLQVEYNPDRPAGEENELVAYPTKAYLTRMDSEYTTNNDKALKDYPFMSKQDFTNLHSAIAAWSDSDYQQGDKSGYSQEQITCADSVYDLIVPYGVESIEEGLFSDLDSDGNVAAEEFDANKDYSIGDLVYKDGTLYMFKALHPHGAWDANHVDPTSTASGITNLGANKDLKNLTLESIKNIDPYAFAGLPSLKSVDITGTDTIGNYAFYGDKNLEYVTISGDTTSIGVRPFRECSKLTDVAFTGTNFTCEDSIIYGLSGNSKTSVVQCLETRGQGTSNTVVASRELAGITSMQDEAFMDCDDVETVNLTESSLGIVPERAFAATNSLYLVELPATVKTIKRDAFLDSNLKQISIPGMNTNIQDEYVFSQTVYKDEDHNHAASEFYQGYHSEESTKKTDVGKDEVKDSRYNPYNDANRTGKVTFNTPDGSFAQQYADDHSYIQATAAAVTYKVTFKDPENESSAQILEVQDVASGECAQIPRGWNPNAHSGKTFLGWESSADDNVYTDAEVPTIPISETTTYKARYSGGACTVTFYDKDNNVIVTKEVTYGNDVSAPEAPTVEGYTFKGWDRYPVSTLGLTNITEDTTFKATYEKVDSSDKHHVVFYTYDDSIVSEQFIADGEAAQTPANPTREGYTFTGWKPADFTNVTKDMDIYAQFEKNSSNGGNNGNNGSSSGNSNGNNGSNGSSSGNSSSTAKTYTVTVINGSGSGTYAEGSTVVVAANEPAKGKAFDKWTTGDVTLVSTSLSATSFKMPGKNVTVTANYKDAATTSTGTVKYATGNSGRPAATGRTATGTTQVQVNKGGVSNVDLASATVRGSTDSFIVKVTETNEATNLVENALNNRFGGLDALKYWPCDISLYDSTGNTKITDTTGLTVEITLPIPDELRQYGGNNKVAAVSNGQLEELGTRFNTVNGTPTVTFTATHFSPYVIYADTNNLVASEMLDASPKTGDPIHPKWFLAIALAAGSVFMFLKKDKKPMVATV